MSAMSEPAFPRHARVVAVVPARNEEGTVAVTTKALLGIRGIDEVLVVADGCADRTAEEARAAGARVLVGRRAMGKGGAIEAALGRGLSADVVLLVDADVGASAGEVERLLGEVLEDRLDLAIGRLPAQAGGGFGAVKGFAAWCIRALTGFRAEAPLSGQRAIRLDVLDACRPLAGRFGVETAMTIDALRLGFRIGEIPVEMSHRATGRGPAGFLHRARQGVDIMLAVLPRAAGLR
jgi:glycosyltransferase involved in cell wall biosynthesis